MAFRLGLTQLELVLLLAMVVVVWPRKALRGGSVCVPECRRDEKCMDSRCVRRSCLERKGFLQNCLRLAHRGQLSDWDADACDSARRSFNFMNCCGNNDDATAMGDDFCSRLAATSFIE